MIIQNVRIMVTTITNQKRGKSFEEEWMEYLFSIGYWVHYNHPAPDGSQPFDIIAIYNGIVSAFDCKTLSGKRFPLNRIESNQETAFSLINAHGVHNTYFVIKTENDIVHLLPSQVVIALKQQGIKSIDITEKRYASICIKQNHY